MRVWLDDCRPMPSDYTHWAKTAQEAIQFLDTGLVSAISLDHDLGDETVVGSGYKVACHIEEGAFHQTIPKLEWKIHSSNPVGRARMQDALDNAETYWQASQ